MNNFQRTFAIFIAAFVLNFLWEHAHSVLYVSYQGGAITNLVLLRAAAFDAAVIALFSFPFFRFESLRRQGWLLYVALAVFAVLLEMWALATNRWVYTDMMPLIPILDVGLTPIVQLGLLCFISLWIADNWLRGKTN